ncbi:hypothetical protein NSK_005847 [Nannochloropsis salina CCMP1776]|uniref:Uncharacterized protein n=1 Tax=Nannochloropsis salina CCMP1776 TaxID=1027361 RepID=A0A4D9CUF3_9STRA|nr:hypothetical protein NSK_005847 [Nannochloropsis salina CCMP1776]|eukprot:TFJ82840.1 hypothetical protein NSK_005847 [Nannochloropsis salina CCMP1776]
MSNGGAGSKNLKDERKLGEGAGKASESPQTNEGWNQELVGAAAAGATLGLMVAGPFMAVVGGIASGVAAAGDEGQIGEVARATGRAVATAFGRVQHFDQEHRVTEKVKTAAGQTIARAQACEKEHQIVSRVKEGAEKAVSVAQTLDRQQHITEKISAGLVQGLDRVTNAMKGKGGKGGDDGERV